MDDPMDIDMNDGPYIPVDRTPVPNVEFCIFRRPGSTSRYLERYGVTLFTPDRSLKPTDRPAFVWSVFELEDMGFKAFLNGSYNFKIERGTDEGIMRFLTDPYTSEIDSSCPRTLENLWFVSYRYNQLPSEHLFCAERPAGYSTIPEESELSPGDLQDLRAAQEREEEATKAKQNAANTPEPDHSPPAFFMTEEGQIFMHDEVETKLIEIEDELKKFSDMSMLSLAEILKRLVGDAAIKKLTMDAEGASALVQKRDSLDYFREMANHPFWQSKPNNAAVKITRAYFGLPVEPLTAINIANAGKNTDDPRMEIERDFPGLSRAVGELQRLSFLDEYTESMRGQPGIRAKPDAEYVEYKQPPQDAKDLLLEFDALKNQRRAPRRTCHVGEQSPVLVDEEEDDGFNFFEYVQKEELSMRGGNLLQLDAEDEDMQYADWHTEHETNGHEFDTPSETALSGNDDISTRTIKEFGSRLDLIRLCEVDLDFAERSDEALEILFGLNGRPSFLDAYLDEYGNIEFEALRPDLEALVGNGLMKDALDILQLQGMEETVVDQIANPQMRSATTLRGGAGATPGKTGNRLPEGFDKKNRKVPEKFLLDVYETDKPYSERSDKALEEVLDVWNHDSIKVFWDDNTQKWDVPTYRSGIVGLNLVDADMNIRSGKWPREELIFEWDKAQQDSKKPVTEATSKPTAAAQKTTAQTPIRDTPAAQQPKTHRDAKRSPPTAASPAVSKPAKAYDPVKKEWSHKFLQDVYEIETEMDDRSEGAIERLLLLEGDAEYYEEFLDGNGKIMVNQVKGTLKTNGQTDVEGLLDMGCVPDPEIVKEWERAQEKPAKAPVVNPPKPAEPQKPARPSPKGNYSSAPKPKTPSPPKPQPRMQPTASETPEHLTPAPTKTDTSGNKPKAPTPTATAVTKRTRFDDEPDVSDGDTIMVNGVAVPPEIMRAFEPMLKNYEALRKKVQFQVSSKGAPRTLAPPRPSGLGIPHFSIPSDDEEAGSDDEDRALAALKLNAPKNDTPEAYSQRLKRFEDLRDQRRRQKAAKRAFVKDHSVHFTEDDLPTVPTFGKGLEEAITFKGAAPTLYLNNLSMQRMREIQMNNREMENVILEREEYCGMCDRYIQFESQYQKDNHYRGHRSTASSCGFCGISFIYMQDSEKKIHLRSHADTKYGAKDQVVPYRDIQKRQDNDWDDVFIFCEACGKDLHCYGTAQQMKNHYQECKGYSIDRQAVFFCHKCGTDITELGDVERAKHVKECPVRHALGFFAKDSHVWTFAQENVPGGPYASEADISRTYFHLLTLIGIPGREDVGTYSSSGDNLFGKLACKFHGCDVDLADLAKRDKLMEHLGVHVGRKTPKKSPCPVDGCPDDFTDFYVKGRDQAEKGGPEYEKVPHLVDRITQHMIFRHGATCGYSGHVCHKCTIRDAKSGAFGKDVRVGNRTKDAQAKEAKKKAEDKKKRQDAEKKKQRQREKDEKEKQERDEAVDAEKERKEQEAATKNDKSPGAGKDDGKKPGRKDDKTSSASKHDGKKPSGKDDDEESDFQPDNKDDDGSDSDSDSGDDKDDKRDKNFRKGKINPDDADAQLDNRPGVYRTLPQQWVNGIKLLTPRRTVGNSPQGHHMNSAQPDKQLPWVLGCRGCGKAIKKDLQLHRSVTNNGKKGCGLDDDMELVVTTERHLWFYRKEMAEKGRELGPYVTDPPMPDAPADQFMWITLRELLADHPMNGAQEMREHLLDASEELKALLKMTEVELPPLDGVHMSFNKSPYQKRKGKKTATKTASTPKKPSPKTKIVTLRLPKKGDKKTGGTVEKKGDKKTGSATGSEVKDGKDGRKRSASEDLEDTPEQKERKRRRAERLLREQSSKK